MTYLGALTSPFLFANDNVKYLTVGGMSGLEKFFSFLDEITGLLGHF